MPVTLLVSGLFPRSPGIQWFWISVCLSPRWGKRNSLTKFNIHLLSTFATKCLTKCLALEICKWIRRSLLLGAGLTEEDKDAKQFPQKEWHSGMTLTLNSDLICSGNLIFSDPSGPAGLGPVLYHLITCKGTLGKAKKKSSRYRAGSYPD